MVGRSHFVQLLAAFGVVVASLLPSGAGASVGARGHTIPAPKGLPAFYSVPKPFPSNKPGTLIKSERVDAPELHGTVYRVMYVSRSQRDKPVAVTGVIVVPDKPAPHGGYPVVTWGHGTNGMADQCAPSLKPQSAAPAANQLLDQGWLVTATDYEGEGTPGLLPYIAGESAARNTIDIVRAARQLKGAHASKHYVVWGHSEGGQTAMYGLKIGEQYAPDLDLRGVVAGAPPSQFNFIYNFLLKSTFKHYLLMAGGGLNAAYGNKAAPLDKILTPVGIDLLPLLEQGCSDYVAQHTKDVAFETVTKTDPFTVPEWKKILAANDPQQFTDAVPTPLLMIQGGSDEQIPPVSTQILANHLCDIGQGLERWIYPGRDHSDVIPPSLPDMIHWIDDRFTGAEQPGAFKPAGQPDIEVSGCPK